MPAEALTGRTVQRIASHLGLSSAVRARTVTPGVVRAYVDADDMTGNLTPTIRQSYADTRARRLVAGLIQAGWDASRNGSVVTVTEPAPDVVESPADPAPVADAPRITPRADLVARLVASGYTPERAAEFADARDMLQAELTRNAPAIAAALADEPATYEEAADAFEAAAVEASRLRADSIQRSLAGVPSTDAQRAELAAADARARALSHDLDAARRRALVDSYPENLPGAANRYDPTAEPAAEPGTWQEAAAAARAADVAHLADDAARAAELAASVERARILAELAGPLAAYDAASSAWSKVCEEEEASGRAPDVRDATRYSEALEAAAHAFAAVVRDLVDGDPANPPADPSSA